MKNSTEHVVESGSLAAIFTDKTRAVATKVSSISSFDDAISYLNSLVDHKDLVKPIIAAPELSIDHWNLLQYHGEISGLRCINEKLRRFSSIDIGLTYCNYGIAETGTIVLNCPDEDLRLATMICDYHICILGKSQIVADSFDIENGLNHFMRNTPDYTAFITGPSRTADIERVLTIGVHGPLELHVLILEDE